MTSQRCDFQLMPVQDYNRAVQVVRFEWNIFCPFFGVKYANMYVFSCKNMIFFFFLLESESSEIYTH